MLLFFLKTMVLWFLKRFWYFVLCSQSSGWKWPQAGGGWMWRRQKLVNVRRFWDQWQNGGFGFLWLSVWAPRPRWQPFCNLLTVLKRLQIWARSQSQLHSPILNTAPRKPLIAMATGRFGPRGGFGRADLWNRVESLNRFPVDLQPLSWSWWGVLWALMLCSVSQIKSSQIFSTLSRVFQEPCVDSTHTNLHPD